MAERISDGSTGEGGPSGPIGRLIAELEGLGSHLVCLAEEALACVYEGGAYLADCLRGMARLAWRMVRVASRITHLLGKAANDLDDEGEDRAQDVRHYANAMRKHLEIAKARLRWRRGFGPTSWY